MRVRKISDSGETDKSSMKWTDLKSKQWLRFEWKDYKTKDVFEKEMQMSTIQ